MNQKQISGVYPQLAVTHQELKNGGNECGIGAVVNYGGKLYWITYPASDERGGKGRIYCMDHDGVMTECAESTGGTHADRLIHHPSGALVLGANVIFPNGEIRSFDVKKLIGRLTGASVHPRAEEGWVYIASMEDGLYEANVYTMEVRTLRKDIIDRLRISGVRPVDRREPQKIAGDHAKGLYTAQGVVIYGNNGHQGAIAEWDQQGDPQEHSSWKMVEHTNFTEITGPAGFESVPGENDPVWALGWDKRSVLLCVRENGRWTRYRLPKASYTQDADHGWYTEWPRIRKVHGTYLLCMHGMMYEFPETFRRGCAGGIRPIARHLKMISDFAEWDGKIVFACDDASCFDNPSLGQCQSNLWFSDFEHLERMSAPSAWGGWYVDEAAAEGKASDPLFVGGFDNKVLCLQVKWEQGGFDVEVDRDGSGRWELIEQKTVPANRTLLIPLPKDTQWVRVTPDRDLSQCTAYVHMFMDHETRQNPLFTAGFRRIKGADERLVALQGPEMHLGFFSGKDYYETDESLEWKPCSPSEFALKAIEDREVTWVEPRFYQTGHSILVIAPNGRRYQLPWLPGLKDARMFVREVVTERSLMNLCGTIYELPRPESGGVARIKPVTTHNSAIEDFVSWRGMLVMCGVEPSVRNEHIFSTPDGNAAVWCGVVDDLWSMGAPYGEGGPLCNTFLLAGECSDPFLLAGYRYKTLALSHDLDVTVLFSFDIDFAGTDDFMFERCVAVQPGKTLEIAFDVSFAPHWIRFRTSHTCRATALFKLWCD